MTIKDSIKKVFGGGDSTTSSTSNTPITHHSGSTATHTATGTAAHAPVGTDTVEQHRTVRAPDAHVPAGTAAGTRCGQCT